MSRLPLMSSLLPTLRQRAIDDHFAALPGEIAASGEIPENEADHVTGGTNAAGNFNLDGMRCVRWFTVKSGRETPAVRIVVTNREPI